MFQDMVQKGEVSFVLLWVLNPVFILFYQNCSWAPTNRAQAHQAIYSSAVAGGTELASVAPSQQVKKSECWSNRIAGVCAQQ